jgi:hypothetical protein
MGTAMPIDMRSKDSGPSSIVGCVSKDFRQGIRYCAGIVIAAGIRMAAFVHTKTQDSLWINGRLEEV